jgi:hypothetical protein
VLLDLVLLLLRLGLGGGGSLLFFALAIVLLALIITVLLAVVGVLTVVSTCRAPRSAVAKTAGTRHANKKSTSPAMSAASTAAFDCVEPEPEPEPAP